MKKTSILAMAFCMLLSMTVRADDSGITNLRVEARNDGSGLIDIYYDVPGPAKVIKKSLEVSFNDGKDYMFFTNPNNLSGDIGLALRGTNYRMVWNTQPELPQVSARLMRVRLKTTDEYANELIPVATERLPVPRQSPALALDTDRNVLVLFGGYSIPERKYFGDTWEWDGTAWKQVSATGPSARNSSAMVYDKARKKMVLFAGSSEGDNPYLNDTWEWDGSSWKQIPVVGPKARLGHAMAYDEERQQTVLFGGFNYLMADLPIRRFSDTWIYDGQKWTSLAVTGPEQRASHKMIFDPVHKNIIMFGGDGQAPNNSYYTDTWLWDGSKWTLAATSGPSGRGYFQIAFDDYYGEIALFGGRVSATSYGDLWRWTGSSWRKDADGLLPSSDGGAFRMNGKYMILRTDGQIFTYRFISTATP